MIYDVPWANDFFGSVFGSTFDYIPEGYKLFYTNMNIGSTYFIALLFVIILIIVDRLVLRKKAQ
jgi:phosphopantetheine adenylyltransferase